MKRNLIILSEQWFFAGVFVLYYFYLLYKYTYSFNYLEIAEYGHYLILPVSCGLLMLALILSYAKKRIFYDITIVDKMALIVLSCCLSLLAFASTKYNFHNEVFCNAVVVLSSFIIFRSLGNEFIQKVIVPIVIVFFLWELYLGYSDFFQNINVNLLPLLIKGHLENSGVYSIYLVFHLPLAHCYVTHIVQNQKWRIGILAILYVAVGTLVLTTQSRSAILSAVCYFGKLIFNRNKLQLHKRFLIILTIIGLVLLICGLIYLKPASAFGRFIIWKISLQHFSEYFWSGIGYGQFPSYYPDWQISYFDSLPLSRIIEMQSADEIFVAYNEPLQILIELGIAWFIVIGVIFSQLVFKSSHPSDKLTFHMRNMFFILFVASLFSYPLHVNLILLTASLCAAFLVPVTYKNSWVGYQTWSKILVVGILSIVILKSLNVYHCIRDWHKMQNNVNMPDKQKIDVYQALYPSLKQSSKFLLDYGIILHTTQNNRSVNVLEDSKYLLVTSATLNTLAIAYEDIGKMDKAILTWKSLSSFIPYKFTYKDKLLNCYLSKKDLANAKKIALLIIALPAKKDDQTIRNIKKNASIILNLNY